MRTATISHSHPAQGRLALAGEEPEDLPPQGQADAPAGDVPPEEKFHWSASRLRRILLCPRQFRYAYRAT